MKYKEEILRLNLEKQKRELEELKEESRIYFEILSNKNDYCGELPSLPWSVILNYSFTILASFSLWIGLNATDINERMIAMLLVGLEGILGIYTYIGISKDIQYRSFIKKTKADLKELCVEDFEQFVEELNHKKYKIDQKQIDIKNNIKRLNQLLDTLFPKTNEEINEILLNQENNSERYLEEFLNEPIAYSDVRLEVNPYDENIHKNCGKNLTKTLFKN